MIGKIWEWVQGLSGQIVGALKVAAASIVARVLGAFGLTVISLEAMLPELQSFVTQYTSGLTGEAAAFLGAIGMGEAMSMIMSALAVRLAAKVMIVPTPVANALGQGGPAP